MSMQFAIQAASAAGCVSVYDLMLYLPNSNSPIRMRTNVEHFGSLCTSGNSTERLEKARSRIWRCVRACSNF
jgi:hypothetical protein